jgi:hypothetical protein
VASLDATVTADNLHERAEAIAVPDFDYLEQTIAGIASALTPRPSGAPAPTSRPSPTTSPE